MEELSANELLIEVNKAIATVLIGGQSYRIGTKQLTRADLGMLRQLKNELIVQTVEESTGLLSNTTVAVFEGR